jgi:hypothetical protein
MSALHDVQGDAIKMDAGAAGHLASIAELIEPGPFDFLFDFI